MDLSWRPGFDFLLLLEFGEYRGLQQRRGMLEVGR